MASRALKDEIDPLAQPVDQPFQPPTDSIQIAVSPTQQKLIVLQVLDDYEHAKKLRGERKFGQTSKGDNLDFDKWFKELRDVYFGQREPKTKPWKFCSNRSLMISMAILETLVARLYPAVYNEDLLTYRPGEVMDEEKVARLNKLATWWERGRCKVRDFFENWIRYAIGFGQVVTESIWHVRQLDTGKMAQPEPIMDEMGQPAMNQDGSPAMIPGAKELDLFETTLSEIVPLEDWFPLADITDLQRDPAIIRRKYLFRDLEEMEANGALINITQSTDPSVTPLKDLLPVADVSSGSNDPEFIAELKLIKLRNQEVECLRWYSGMDLDKDGYPEQLRVMIVPKYNLYIGGVSCVNLSARGLRHLDVSRFLPRLDEPDSWWGLGVLEQVKELSQEIDAIFNQLTDANTLSIVKGGFYDPGSNANPGDLVLAPNTFHPVSNPSQAIFIPPMDVRIEQLLNSIRLVLEFIERLTAASSYIMGKESEIVGGSGTATRTQEIVNSANQRHAIPVYRLREGAARILTQRLDLLQKHMPPGLEKRVLGHKHEAIFEDNELSAEGIAGEFDAYLLPDDSFGSKDTQRMIAAELYQLMLPNPLIMSDPAKVYKLTADVFSSRGKDPESYLGPQPPISQAMSPHDEHTLMLQGEFNKVAVTPMQNPIEHLMEHQAFLQDSAFLSLPPSLQQQVSTFLQQHMQQHMQMMAQMMQLANKQKGGESNGASAEGAGQPSPNGAAGSSPSLEAKSGLGAVPQQAQGGNRAQRSGESQPLTRT